MKENQMLKNEITMLRKMMENVMPQYTMINEEANEDSQV